MQRVTSSTESASAAASAPAPCAWLPMPSTLMKVTPRGQGQHWALAGDPVPLEALGCSTLPGAYGVFRKLFREQESLLGCLW